MDNFFIVTFTIPSKLPELATDLDEDHNLCRQGAVDGLCGGRYESAGDLGWSYSRTSVGKREVWTPYLLPSNVNRFYFRHN